MIALSVNQLVSETRKAMLGKGNSFGVADDISRAIEWLASFEHVPSDELYRYLSNPQDNTPQRPHHEDGEISLAGDIGLLDVMAVLDFAGAYQAGTLTLSGLIYPMISLGLIALRAAPPTGSYHDNTGQALSALVRTINDKPAARLSDTISLHHRPYHKDVPAAWPGRVLIEARSYDLLKKMAYETYVPSSELSRAAGAGAGLNDND